MRKQRRNTELLGKIAKRIKQLRKEKGVSQENFYIDTDVHIARIEQGRVNISVSTLQDICDYFGITIMEFFSGMK